MEFKNLEWAVKDRMATITINRPDVRNALDLQTVNELHAAIAEVAGSNDIGVAIITGAGEKVFVSGADIRDLRARKKLDALKGINSRLFKAIEDCDKPVIAAVNGFALGGGCELALACDIRICVETAMFGLPETSLGIIPGAGGLYRLPKIVGMGITRELVLTGELLNASRALQIGLVSRVVPAKDLLKSAEEIAGKILARGPLAVRIAKRSLNLMTQIPTEAAIALDEYAQGILFESDDKMEGMTAFLEKRKPDFKGN